MTQEFPNAAACWKTLLTDVSQRKDIVPVIEDFARNNTSPAEIVFGTSGWRGEIGSDFTFNNVRIVTTAIIRMFRQEDSAIMEAMGVSDFQEIQSRGVLVGHDNRLLGREFAMEVIGLLQQEGIRTWYAGEAVTPEFSAGIEMLRASCSINLTPSHNPANYGGFKFNPADGGPAGPEITGTIETIANKIMETEPVFEQVKPREMEEVNLTDLYIQYISERKTLDLRTIRDFIQKEDCILCIDNVHGATRGKIQRIIGTCDAITFLRTEDDVLFGGIAPEPSEDNMQGVEAVLRKSDARFKLGVIMDPDGDRIRYSDGNMQIPMNYFGAMALHFLHVHKGFSGVVVKSVGTSNLVNAIADKLGVPVKETGVGFKNFRPYLVKTAKERAIVAFEESDGISGYNHTLEKDALFGALLAVEMVAVTGKNLSDYLTSIMDEFGYYYPDRSGIEVEREFAGEALKNRLMVIRERYRKGTEVKIGGKLRTVRNVIITDGTKLLFDDGSWLMIRPSGTEPKVRFYIEARTEKEKGDVFSTAKRITRDALQEM